MINRKIGFYSLHFSVFLNQGQPFYNIFNSIKSFCNLFCGLIACALCLYSVECNDNLM